jgi:hypothetical protein
MFFTNRQNLSASYETMGPFLEKYLVDMKFWQDCTEVFVFWKHSSCLAHIFAKISRKTDIFGKRKEKIRAAE